MTAERQTDNEIAGQDGARRTLRRRGILAIGAAVVAGIAAKGAAQPVAATTVTNSNFIANGTDVGFETAGTFLQGVSASGSTHGVQGLSAGGAGVFGSSADGTGVVAFSTRGDAVVGTTFALPNGGKTGVIGKAFEDGNFGVFGSGGTGVFGESTGGNGVVGVANARGTSQVVAGVFGDSTHTYGVIGRSTAPGFSGLTAIASTPGVAALAATSMNANAFAAFFTGLTVVQGNFVATGGTKSAAVKDASGQHRLVYCVESPESWFEDFGSGKLVGGKAEITLDPVFTQIAHTDHYHVFLTGYDEQAGGLVVSERRVDGFVVKERNKGASTQAFSYRVVAKRADIKGERLATFDLPKINIPDESKLQKPAPPKVGPSPIPPTKP